MGGIGGIFNLYFILKLLLARQELTAPPVPRAQSVLRSAPAYWLMSLRPMLVQIL